MAVKEPYNVSVWSKYYGPNLGYIQEKYEQFVKDPSSVEHHYRDLFTVSGPPPLAPDQRSPAACNFRRCGVAQKGCQSLQANRQYSHIRPHGCRY